MGSPANIFFFSPAIPVENHRKTIREKPTFFSNEQYLVLGTFITVACKDGHGGRQGLSHDHHLLKKTLKCAKYVLNVEITNWNHII